MLALKLDPSLLEAFVAVADRLSFTRAAAQLNRSQAAISLQIKRLEDRVGVPLFLRSTSHVELSAAGREFLADARRLMRLHDEVVSRFAEPQEPGRVRIGVMEDYGTRRLPRVLSKVIGHFPRVEVEMEIGLTATMVDRLDSAFDVVLAMHREGAADGELVSRESAVWAGAADFSNEFGNVLPLALSGPDCLFRQWASRALEKAGIAWRLAYTSTSVAAVEAVVAEGLAITVSKRSLIPRTLRELDRSMALPRLPGAEIRLHRAQSLRGVAAAFVDDLACRLSTEPEAATPI